MARIAGVDIPRDKRIEVSLTYIYGVGLTRSQAILAKTGVNPDIRVKDLEDGDLQKLRNAMEEYTLEGDLRRQEGMALKRLQDIGCLCSSLSGEGGAFASTLETTGACGRPGNHLTSRIGDGHDGVVEGALDVSNTVGNVALGLFGPGFFDGFSHGRMQSGIRM